MTRRHLAPAALLAAIALAAVSPAAGAKQISALTVCGADGCRTVDRAIGQAMHDLGGAGIATAPRPAPHFRIVMHIGDGKREFGTSRVVYVPSSRALGNDGGWSRLNRGAAAKLRRVLDGREPLPAAGLARSTRDPAAEESRPAEVVLPPAAATTAKAQSGGSGLLWWSLGGLAVLAALAFLRPDASLQKLYAAFAPTLRRSGIPGVRHPTPSEGDHMSRHGRRHRRRGKRKFDVAATPVTPPAAGADSSASTPSAPSAASADASDD